MQVFNINVLYELIFTDMTPANKLIYTYIILLLIISFMLIMVSASSVNYEANKSFKILNSLMVFNLYNNNTANKKTVYVGYKNSLFLNNIKVNIKLIIFYSK